MNKPELITAAAQRAGVTKKDTQQVLDALLEAMAEALAQGEAVKLSGFGSFEVQTRQARTGRDLNTGESLSIPETRVPVFKPSQKLKEQVK